MAKQCDACKQTYADELNYCPHCGAWHRGFTAGPSSSVDFVLDPLGSEASGHSSMHGHKGKKASDDIIDLEVITEGSSDSGKAPPPLAAKVVGEQSPSGVPLARPAHPQGQPPAAPARRVETTSADFQLGDEPAVGSPNQGSSGEFDLGALPPTASPSGVLSDELIEIAPEGSSGDVNLAQPPAAGQPASPPNVPTASAAPAAPPQQPPALGRPTQLVPTSGPPTHIAPRQAPPAAPPRRVETTSADFQLGGEPPVGSPGQGSSGEFDLGELPPASSPSGVLSGELIEISPEGSSSDVGLARPPVAGQPASPPSAPTAPAAPAAPQPPARGKPTQLAPTSGPPTQIASRQAPPAGAPPGGSTSADFHLGEAPPVGSSAGGSSGEFDLGELPPTGSPSGAPSDELIEVRPEGSSGELDLGELPPATTGSGTAIEDLVEIQMSGQSDVALAPGEEQKPGSDVSLAPGERLQPGSDVAPAPHQEAEDVDILHLLDDEDSAVTRGAGVPAPGAAEGQPKPPSGVTPRETGLSVIGEDAEAMTRRRDDSSAVDLTAPPSGDLPASWISGLESPSPAPQRAVAPPPAAPGYTPAAEAEEEAIATLPETPVKQGGGVLPWLGGTAVGIIVGVAACVVLWAAGVVPPKEGGSSANKGQGPSASNGAAAPAPRGSVQDSLARGDFADVLKSTKDAGNDPEQLAARGEARWLAYLQKQPKNLKADDQDVKEAIADLDSAQTAEAKLWLGQIQEGLGNYQAARKVYEAGGKAFPQQKAVFDTALDRLDALTEEPDGAAKPADKSGALLRQPALGEETALLLLVALQAEQPAPVQGEPEAGSFFWSAVKQAKNQNYAEAIKALDEARKIHDQRRFQRLRKSQNPVSDPTEAIFLRACDELKGYWQLRAQLKSAGYADVAKSRDLGKAVTGLLADLKNKAANDPTLLAVVERLKKEKDVASADPNLTDVAKDLDLVLDSRKKQAEQLAALQEALKSAKLPGDPADLQKGLAKLVKEQKDAADALAAANKEAERLQADKKAAEVKLKVADEKLKTALEARKVDAQTLQEVTGKLAAAKVVAADAKGEALVKGVDQVLADRRALEEKVKTAGGDRGADVLTLQKVAGKLAAAKVVAADAKGDAVVQGVDRVLADRKTAEENLKQAQAAAKVAEEKLTQAQAAVKTAEEQLKTALAGKQADEKTLQELADKLAAAKVVAANAKGEALVQGLDQVLADRRTADAKLRSVEEKLKSATDEQKQMLKLFEQRVRESAQGAAGSVSPAEQNPALELSPVGDAVAAERVYARGLANFWAGQYAAAEADFALAVRTAGSTAQDARYYYFLGLAQIAQGKSDDARATFRQAGRLERENRPPSRVVSSALERIQGQLRRTVDTYRP